MIDVLEHEEFREGRTYTNFIDKNMGDRQVDNSDLLDLASAVSTAALMRGSTAVSGNTAASKTGHSPWLTIGSWEIGSKIGGGNK